MLAVTCSRVTIPASVRPARSRLPGTESPRGGSGPSTAPGFQSSPSTAFRSGVHSAACSILALPRSSSLANQSGRVRRDCVAAIQSFLSPLVHSLEKVVLVDGMVVSNVLPIRFSPRSRLR